MSKCRLPPWPSGDEHSSSTFFTAFAECCAADRPDLVERFRAFADDYTAPGERERRRLERRDGMIRRVACDYYPSSLGSDGRARLISEHLAEMDPEADCMPAVRRQNLDLREIIEINGDSLRGLGFENVKKILRSR